MTLCNTAESQNNNSASETNFIALLCLSTSMLFGNQIAEVHWSIPLILQHELRNVFYTF